MDWLFRVSVLFFLSSFSLSQIQAQVNDSKRKPIVSGSLSFVTGELRFPTPLILGNLGLSGFLSSEQKKAVQLDTLMQQIYSSDKRKNWLIQASVSTYKGKYVLSLGEGVSGLIPYLLENAIQAFGLDFAYYEISLAPSNKRTKPLKEYLNRFEKNLIQADASDLSNVYILSDKKLASLGDESFDMVVSHAMLTSSWKKASKVLSEGFRVLKPGGTFRTTIATYLHSDRIAPSKARTHEEIVNSLKFLLAKSLPSEKYEYAIFEGMVGLISKLSKGSVYPSDSFKWKKGMLPLPRFPTAHRNILLIIFKK